MTADIEKELNFFLGRHIIKAFATWVLGRVIFNQLWQYNISHYTCKEQFNLIRQVELTFFVVQLTY